MSYVGKAKNIIGFVGRKLLALRPKRVKTRVEPHIAPVDFVHADTIPVDVLRNSASFIDSALIETLAGTPKDPRTDLAGVEIYRSGTQVCVADELFEVGKLLGKGGEGSVYLGTRISTGEEVVLKFARYPGEDMQMEADVTAKIGLKGHPGIIRYVAHNDECLVIEWVRGGETLEECIQRNGRLSPETAIKLQTFLYDALAYAAEQGVVHRDVKPENIMVIRDDNGEIIGVKILDWGVAAKYDLYLKERGTTMGSLAFCDAQQLVGRTPGMLGVRSDMYSAGLMGKMMHTGRNPLSDRDDLDPVNPDETLAARYLRLHSGLRLDAHPSVPQPMLMFYQKMTARNPGDRYADWPQAQLAFHQASRSLGISIPQSLS